MAAEVLFAGGRLESVKVLSSTPVMVTTAGRFDSAYADGGIHVLAQLSDVLRIDLHTQSGGVLAPTTVVSGEKCFLHFEAWSGGAISTGSGATPSFMKFLDSSLNAWFQLRRVANSGGIIQLVFNSGTSGSPVWTQIGSSFAHSVNVSVIDVYDIELEIGSPHQVKIYRNGSLVTSGSFTQASFTNIGHVYLGSPVGPNLGVGIIYSQIMVTRDISTVGAKVKTCRATAAGANTGWSGSHDSVNNVVNNDATLQNAPTAGLKSTHAMGDVTVPSGFEIKSVFHWMRAKNDGTGPTQIKSVLRHGGTDYATADLYGIGLGYGPIGARYDTDPLGTNWTQTSWNAIEAGYEAAT